ncbi:MAG TPA: YihY/virulence factor BrkB family protein [Terracidiphilus sp.]|jgi:membrane protein
MPRLFVHIRKALLLALDHDMFGVAKAAAYSGMLFSFPALVVLTTLLAQVPEGSSMVGEIRGSLDQFLPEGSMDLLRSALETNHYYSTKVLLSATSLSIFAGLGLMLSLMEGFRRAYQLPRNEWSYRQRALRAFLLVPIVLVPLWLATLLLVFGQEIEIWMINNSTHELRHIVLVSWRLVRWALALTTSVTVLSALYHFGTRRLEHWKWVIPGALGATAVWFPATLAFGWYVTRVANYSMFYGSFTAGIATLVWLYITSLSALLGAELNGVLFRVRQERLSPSPPPASLASSL